MRRKKKKTLHLAVHIKCINSGFGTQCVSVFPSSVYHFVAILVLNLFSALSLPSPDSFARFSCNGYLNGMRKEKRNNFCKADRKL